ncbi:hypothetical protein BC835DRAFT_135589 [Cytidiella melzeri]|nr:hypothetical protein BC835DRAFT_135589 [Cytidiella melzeri]
MTTLASLLAGSSLAMAITVPHPSTEVPSVAVPASIMTRRRRKSKIKDPSAPLVLRTSYHKGSPLTGDARAECMLAVAKTLGRRKMGSMAQLGTSAEWYPPVTEVNRSTTEVGDPHGKPLTVRQKEKAIDRRTSPSTSSVFRDSRGSDCTYRRIDSYSTF